MEDVLGSFGGGKSPPDYPDSHEKGKAIKKSSQYANWNLQSYIMGCLMGHHIMGECSENRPPVAGDIQKNEKNKQNRKKDFDGSTLALIEIENLVQCITPELYYPFHITAIIPPGHSFNADLLDWTRQSLVKGRQ